MRHSRSTIATLRNAMFPLFIAATALAQATPAPTTSAPPRFIRAVQRSGDIRVDGKLDEAAWNAAVPSSAFTQAYPAPGKPAPDGTEIRVLYDESAIYVGIRMFDTHPDSVVAGLARRDATAATGIYSDWVHLIIDSYHDKRTAFRFSTTPRGVQKDVYTFNDGSEDLNWDAVWEVGTRIDSLGWVAEYRIPLSQLRYGKQEAGSERVWGLQVQRDIARRNERDTWSPWTPQDGAFVSRFGDLSGLLDLSAPERVELMPYVSSKLTRAPGSVANPFYKQNDARPSAGADLKYGLPGGLTLSATVNPDFGQVEVDPAVVNLSAFETSFPEKRPFFLEGSDVFGFGQVVRQNGYGGGTFLYSRRIGRQPQRAVGGDVAYVDVPSQTTIATAAKVTGKTKGWTVGLLDAVTTEQNARVQTSTKLQYDSPVEPLTNYFAGRLKRDFRGGATFVGTLLQNTTRAVSDTAFSGLLRSNATIGGVDFEHDMMNRKYILSGFLSGSQVDGSRQAIASTQRNSTHYFQRPDATYLRYDSMATSIRGYMGEIAIAKNGVNFWSVDYKETSPGLELNDFGFQTRTDFRALSTLIGRQDGTAGKHFRSFAYFVYSNDTWNYGGDAVFHGYAAAFHSTLNNLWGVNGGASVSPSYFNDRLLRGGPVAENPGSWSGNASVSSDSRRRVIATVGTNLFRDESGARSTSFSTSLNARPSSNVNVNFGPSVNRGRGTAQYIRVISDASVTSTYGRRYVFADLEQTTLSLDTRVDVTFSPSLSFVMYAQPFVSSGRYENLKEFLTPRKYDFAVYGRDRGTSAYNATSKVYTIDPDGAGAAPAFTVGDPNFNVRSLRGNAVMRWDYRPGSSLYFVWQQERSDFEQIGDFETRRDVSAIFRGPATNVFLIKATYWMGR
ncbi:MAG: DUF5916 domain-containing protein [Gemmatimonadota bacterium]